jgi:hypothetical protein
MVSEISPQKTGFEIKSEDYKTSKPVFERPNAPISTEVKMVQTPAKPQNETLLLNLPRTLN